VRIEDLQAQVLAAQDDLLDALARLAELVHRADQSSRPGWLDAKQSAGRPHPSGAQPGGKPMVLAWTTRSELGGARSSPSGPFSRPGAAPG
jgi:hypothetical protein